MGEQRDAYVEKLKGKLDEWNAEIDKLQVRANSAHEEMLVSFNKQIEDLKNKRDDLKGKIDEMHRRGEGAWEDVKAGADIAWKVLGESIESAKARFK